MASAEWTSIIYVQCIALIFLFSSYFPICDFWVGVHDWPLKLTKSRWNLVGHDIWQRVSFGRCQEPSIFDTPHVCGHARAACSAETSDFSRFQAIRATSFSIFGGFWDWSNTKFQANTKYNQHFNRHTSANWRISACFKLNSLVVPCWIPFFSPRQYKASIEV